MEKTLHLEEFITAEVAVLLARWLRYLSSEKRYSDHTISNYTRDLGEFFNFAQDHSGASVSRKTLEQFSLSDFRAYLTRRKLSGLSAKSMARGLSALRTFYKFLDRRERNQNPQDPPLDSPPFKRKRDRKSTGKHLFRGKRGLDKGA